MIFHKKALVNVSNISNLNLLTTNLQGKSTDWFLYDGNIGRWRVKEPTMTPFAFCIDNYC